jgi:hypothetical protein
LELLDERKMNYAFPINKTELLLSSGFSLLWQSFELSPDSKLAKDNKKSLIALIQLLIHDSPSTAAEFQRVARAFVTFGSVSPAACLSPPLISPNTVFDRDRRSMPAPDSKPKSARRHLQAIASRFSSLTKPYQPPSEEVPRRATVPTVGPPYLSQHNRKSSQISLTSARSLPVFSVSSPPPKHPFLDLPPSTVNLDYLPLGEDQSSAYFTQPQKEKVVNPNTDWSQDISVADPSSVYDGLCNDLFEDEISHYQVGTDVPTLANSQEWLDQEWPMSALDLSSKGPVPQSVLSASEDSITSGGDTFSGCGSNNGSTSSGQIDYSDTGNKTFRGIAIPT